MDTVIGEPRPLVRDDCYITDASLLAEFVETGCEPPFAELVRRHGPMVLGTCRRMLGNSHDAEDAAQAVFLVLAKKAGSLLRRDCIAPWLQRVSRNVCLNARSASSRRQRHEQQAAELVRQRHSDNDSGEAVEDLLDGAIAELPERFRLPIVLFHLQGYTVEEAARILDTRPGTIKSRLSRGREMLKSKLVRRGAALAGLSMSRLLESQTLACAVDASFVSATSQVAKMLATGQSVAGGVVAAEVVSIYEAAMRTTAMAHSKFMATVAAVAATIVFFAVGLAYVTFPRDKKPAAGGAIENRVAQADADAGESIKGEELDDGEMAGNNPPNSGVEDDPAPENDFPKVEPRDDVETVNGLQVSWVNFGAAPGAIAGRVRLHNVGETRFAVFPAALKPDRADSIELIGPDEEEIEYSGTRKPLTISANDRFILRPGGHLDVLIKIPLSATDGFRLTQGVHRFRAVYRWSEAVPPVGTIFPEVSNWTGEAYSDTRGVNISTGSIPAGREERGLRVGVSVRRTQIRLGEPIGVTLYFTNVTSEPLNFVPYLLLQETITFDILGGDGKTIRYRGGEVGVVTEQPRLIATLPPGQTYSVAVTFRTDEQGHYPIEQPGTYRLVANYIWLLSRRPDVEDDSIWAGTVSSNPVQFAVVDETFSGSLPNKPASPDLHLPE